MIADCYYMDPMTPVPLSFHSGETEFWNCDMRLARYGSDITTSALFYTALSSAISGNGPATNRFYNCNLYASSTNTTTLAPVVRISGNTTNAFYFYNSKISGGTNNYGILALGRATVELRN